jgi:hypothetical protein
MDNWQCQALSELPDDFHLSPPIGCEGKRHVGFLSTAFGEGVFCIFLAQNSGKTFTDGTPQVDARTPQTLQISLAFNQIPVGATQQQLLMDAWEPKRKDRAIPGGLMKSFAFSTKELTERSP